VLVGAADPVFFIRQPGQTSSGFLAALAGSLYGTSAEEMEVMLKGADSLDLVEIVMEIEEAMRPSS
jgi:hypothetical protein